MMNATLRPILPTLLTLALLATPTHAGESQNASFVQRGSWLESLLASRQAQLQTPDGKRLPIPRMDHMRNFTVALWFKTADPGVLFTKSPANRAWTDGGKFVKIENDNIGFETMGSDVIRTNTKVRDNAWRHFAVTGESGKFTVYLNGERVGGRHPSPALEAPNSVLRIGAFDEHWPDRDGVKGYRGELDDMRIYQRALTNDEIRAHYEGKAPENDPDLTAHYPFDGNARDATPNANHPSETLRCTYLPGKIGQALHLSGDSGRVLVPGDQIGPAFLDAFFAQAETTFPEENDLTEMAWEQEDGIWTGWWSPDDFPDLARRYAAAAYRVDEIAEEAARLAVDARTREDLLAVRALYHKSRRADATERIFRFRNPEASALVVETYARNGLPPKTARNAIVRFQKLQADAEAWIEGPMPPAAVAAWKSAYDALARETLLANSRIGNFEELLFVRRTRYNSNHYYTNYVNSSFDPGGNICALNLRTGKVREIVQGLENGVFGKFDLSFDAKRIVFAWKSEAGEGYRIYQCNIDGSNLRQLTFRQDDEDELHRKYRVRYHHGTDDMQPCYLPDGGIVFISTRCQYGILCDAPDDFTTTVLYRMEADGSHMQKLTNSSVSEASPSITNDGRILYTRWEYVDKGAVSVKCLWSMRPDGSGSSEVYGADVFSPPTLIQPRAIPGSNNQIVAIGCPHYPQNAVGTVIRIDAGKDLRSREPMTYMTQDVDILHEGSFWWDPESRWGERVFKGPNPLSRDLFLVSMTNGGFEGYKSRTDWGLQVLDEKGRTLHLYTDPEYGAFHPTPLRPRKRPPVLPTIANPKLAAKGLAHVIVADVHQGMEGIAPGTIKYLRVNEQVPRPWAARRRWGGDEYDQQHAVITKDTNLGLKVQHGIVPVEEDGSASFYVPADRNIFFQALDENFLEVQRERTYVNYRAGETRSCVGCHERPAEAVPGGASALQALLHEPRTLGPQPGEEAGSRVLSYAHDVQPVLDAHCVECHSGDKLDGDLDLSGTMTRLFSRSYENLVPERRGGDGRRAYDLVGPTIGENHPKSRNVQYLPPRSFGSHASVLAAMLNPDKIDLRASAANVRIQQAHKEAELKRLEALGRDAYVNDIRALNIELDELRSHADKLEENAEHADRLVKSHAKVKLSPEEMVRLTTWIDCNGQYYGSWWGRRNIQYEDHPNFRPASTFGEAINTVSPVPEEER